MRLAEKGFIISFVVLASEAAYIMVQLLRNSAEPPESLKPLYIMAVIVPSVALLVSGAVLVSTPGVVVR